MPKLKPELLEDRRLSIESAALKCFLKTGYHGTTMRQIALAAGVSLGNFYIYYPDKIAVFSSLLRSQSHEFLYSKHALNDYFSECDFPNDLKKLAAAVRSNVERFAAYFKLVYIDVVEFDGKHIRKVFSDLDSKVKSVIGDQFKKIGKLGRARSIDPSFAFITIYLGFYHYFVLTQLFRAKNVYGAMSDEQVIRNLIDIYTNGIAQ